MAEKTSQYQRTIIKQLYFSGDLSCAELSLHTDKSLPLITKMINGLIDNDVVRETGYASSTGGRRPVMYSLRPDVLHVVAVAMDQFVTRIGIIDMQNKLISSAQSFDLPLPNNDRALDQLTQNIKSVVESSGIPKEKLAGIGIGMPGFVDAKKGINYSFITTPGKTITQHIFEQVGLPVFIDNDSSLIALAEHRFGAARGKRNAMVVNIGWGVGLGMICNSQLFRGQNGFAGEFSHIPLFLNGKQCSCGKFGCLETETSLLVIIEKMKEGLSVGKLSMLQRIPPPDMENVSKLFEQINNAAHKGDQFAIELFSEAGYNIGRGVAILIHLLNPELVVLSGRGSVVGKIWQAPVQHSINEHCIPRLAENTTIEISKLGYEAELIGAAALVMENFEHIHMEKKATHSF
jgi:predicted NBD/HSP70 family sugar kinase